MIDMEKLLQNVPSAYRVCIVDKGPTGDAICEAMRPSKDVATIVELRDSITVPIENGGVNTAIHTRPDQKNH